jgi:thymidylate kinase
MLITVSGIVGSGKTTVARHIVGELESRGASVSYRRFQSLPCFKLFHRSFYVASSHASQPDVPSPTPTARGVGHQRRILTARATLTYVARILAFRILRSMWPRNQWQVCNRYFYDYLAHYRLGSRRERLYLTLIRSLIPRPDLAILLVAPSETISQRRPLYAPEYISNVGHGYDSVCGRFPELVEVCTDGSVPATDRIDALLRERLVRTAAFRPR